MSRQLICSAATVAIMALCGGCLTPRGDQAAAVAQPLLSQAVQVGVPLAQALGYLPAGSMIRLPDGSVSQGYATDQINLRYDATNKVWTGQKLVNVQIDGTAIPLTAYGSPKIIYVTNTPSATPNPTPTPVPTPPADAPLQIAHGAATHTPSADAISSEGDSDTNPGIGYQVRLYSTDDIPLGQIAYVHLRVVSRSDGGRILIADDFVSPNSGLVYSYDNTSMNQIDGEPRISENPLALTAGRNTSGSCAIYWRPYLPR